MTFIEPTISPALDEHSLLKQVADDPEVLLRVVQVFNADSRQILDRMVDGFGRRDAGEVRRCAHLFKGALLTLGAGPAAVIADRIEEMGRAGNLEDGTATLSALRCELVRLEEALAALIGSVANA